MDDLVAFLAERLDEDEARANRVQAAIDAGWNYFDETPTELIDPARALREVESKRKILALHAPVWRNIGYEDDGDTEYAEIEVCGLCVPKHSHFASRQDVPEGPCATVRALAAVYSDQPGYRQDWA